MPHHLVCSCGKDVTLEAGSAAAVCPVCGASLKLPQGEDGGGHTEEAVAPVSVEQVSSDKGPCWKIVCACHKRILVPQRSVSTTGRCPKCGRLLKLPFTTDAPDVDRGPAEHMPKGAHAPSALLPEEDLSDLVLDLPPSPAPSRHAHQEVFPAETVPRPHPAAVEHNTSTSRHIEEPASRAAALRTADILRSKKLSERTPGLGLISAWPLAGRLPRALAGFIDLTIGLVAATLIIVGGSLGFLPENSRYLVVPVVAFFTAVLLNDCLLQAFGGSIGKRLVVLTLRTPEGLTPPLPVILLRAVLKWLLVPGWALVLLHPAQRTLHDLICNTYVMKGRVRHG